MEGGEEAIANFTIASVEMVSKYKAYLSIVSDSMYFENETYSCSIITTKGLIIDALTALIVLLIFVGTLFVCAVMATLCFIYCLFKCYERDSPERREQKEKRSNRKEEESTVETTQPEDMARLI